MVPSLDGSKTPYTKLGARPEEFSYEEAMWSQKRHGFPYSWYDKDDPNSVLSIFSRLNINSWLEQEIGRINHLKLLEIFQFMIFHQNM